MTRFIDGTIVIGKRIELTEDEILRLEIELIELLRMLDLDKLEYNPIGDLIVTYEPMLEFMDQQSQAHLQAHSNTQPTSSSSTPTPI